MIRTQPTTHTSIRRLVLADLDKIARPFFMGLGPTCHEGAQMIAEIRRLWKERDAWKREAFAFALLYGTEHGRAERLREDNAALRARCDALIDELTVIKGERELEAA